MPAQTRPSTDVWSCAKRLLGVLVALCLMILSAVTFADPASADSAVRPRSGSFTVQGAGYGHGYGLSQYGAYGAARKGLTWKRILAFYYPGTTLGTMTQFASANGDHAYLATVTRIQVLSRDGQDPWGGRVTKIKITGDTGSVTVAGSTFQHTFGMRSSLHSVGEA